MHPITASSAAASPEAIVALPGQDLSHSVPPAFAGSGRSGAPMARPGDDAGPLRNGNPRGNPNLAPRCGAKARTTGCACQAPAMANGRCRSHGGKSTGPRTPTGLANLAAANTTHGNYAQAGLGAELRVHIRHCRVVARRIRLKQAASRYLRWLPRALAARLQADEATELHAPMHYSQFQDAPVPGRAPCKAGRDARRRFAAPPPPVLRGRKAELARVRAEAAALAPWKAAIARARMIKRVMTSQDRTARRAELGRDAMQPMPPGACPGGRAVRSDGAAGEGSDTDSMNRGAGGATAGAACEGSDTNSMNRDAGGGTAATRADAPAAALAPKDGAAGEGSDTNSMNRGAGGGMAGARAEAVAPRGGAACEGSDTNPMNSGAGGGTAAARAEVVAPRDGAACEGSDTNSMNSGAGGGTAATRADAPAAAVAPKGGAASEGSDTNSMNRDAGGGTAAARAEAPAAAVAPRDGAACEDSDTNSMNSGAGGGAAGARAEAPAAAVAPKDGTACEDSDTNSMNSGAGGGAAGARAEIPAAAVAPKDAAACEDSDTNSMNSGAGGGTAASDAILAALPNRAARRRWQSLQRRTHPAPAACSHP
jgi:hypothetical protein